MCFSRIIIALALLVTAVHLGATEPWMIGERELPAPAGSSSALQASIAVMEQPDVALRRVVKPETESQWRALIKQRAQERTVPLEELARLTKTEITRDTVAGVGIHRVMPSNLRLENKDRVLLYIHGGAYVFGGGDAGVREGALIAGLAGISVISIDYRMPPDHPHPAAINDVEQVYRALLKTHKPAVIGMGGTSAGGGLTLAAIHRFKSAKLALPGALFLGTPWADLTKTSDSLFTNEGIDHVLVTYDGMLSAAALLYANGADLKNPLLSPVYGDFAGFPPSYLVTGTRDLFLSDTARTHRKLRAAGVIADLNVYEGISHAEYAFAQGSPEWQQAYGELAAFLMMHLE